VDCVGSVVKNIFKMNDHLKHISSLHRQKNLNFYKWTSIFFLSLALISGSVLTYQWWEKRQRLAELEEKNKREIQQYELQKNHLVSIANLSQNPNKNLLITKILIFLLIH
jgi:hypothetical protein